jgi:hypothetical protein
VLTGQRLTLRNVAAAPAGVTVEETARTAAATALAYRTEDPVNGVEWPALPALLATNLAAGGEAALDLALQRQRLATPTYGSLLDLRDNAGTRHLIPVTGENPGFAGGAALRALHGPRRHAPASPFAGLWVGAAFITGVSEVHSGVLQTNTAAAGTVLSNQFEQVTRTGVSTNPTPVPAEFELRLICHVDAAGQARLLKEVIQLWRDGTYRTNDAGDRVVDRPGSYVLLTDETRLGEFRPAGLRDGVGVGRRISSAHFDFPSFPTNNFLPLAGTVGTNGVLGGNYTTFKNHPTNPLRHKFHPDHDNLDPTFRQAADPSETFEITRLFELHFTPADPAPGPAVPDYGHGQLAGHYYETVAGLHREPIYAAGTFRLTRVSELAELNPPATP